MRRSATAVAAALLLAACARGAETAAPSPTPTPTPTQSATPTPTPSPAPAPVTMTTRTVKGAAYHRRWTVAVPSLHGLSTAAADARANAVLATVGTGYGDPPQEGDYADDATIDVTADLAAYDTRYATVETTSSFYAEGAAHSAETHTSYVFDRATGKRLDLASFLKDGGTKAAEAYLRKALPRVLDFTFNEDVAKFAITKETPFVPLPEGIEITFAEYEVAPYAAGMPVVTVPWSRLTAYLRLPPATGDADPPYRDGERLTGRNLSDVRAVAGGDVTRVERVQWTAGRYQWVLATRGTAVVVLKSDNGRYVVSTCAEMPADARASVSLTC